AHEFSEVGKVTGATAAVQQQAELRMKAFEAGKFAEIKEDIAELKSELTGKPIDLSEVEAIHKEMKEYDDLDYRKTHYAKLKPVPMNTLAFWKVALVGLAVGAIAGVILGETHLAADLFTHIAHPESEIGKVISGLMETHGTAISTLVFGVMG